MDHIDKEADMVEGYTDLEDIVEHNYFEENVEHSDLEDIVGEDTDLWDLILFPFCLC